MPKIHQLRLALRRHNDVGRLEVAMDHSPLVGVSQRRESLGHVVAGLPEAEGTLAQAFFQGAPLDVLHDHEELVIGSQRGVQPGDVGMVETGQHLDLAHEALGQIRRLGQVGEEHFHRLGAVGDGVAHLVDLTHSPFAQDANDLIVSDCVADIECHTEPRLLVVHHVADLPPARFQ